MASDSDNQMSDDFNEPAAPAAGSGFFSRRIGPTNPYVAGNPVGGSSAFVGREGLLRDVVRRLSDSQHRAVVLYGQRRVGKTSILQQLMAALATAGTFQPVYFDLQDQARRSLGSVVSDLAHCVAAALGLPAPEPSGDPAQWFAAHWLPGVLETLPDPCSLVILFDEFDVLTNTRSDQAAASFFPYLRQLLTDMQGRMRFVFVIGRNIDDLDSIAKSLFKGAPALRVSLLARDEAIALITMSERCDATLSWSPEAVEEALTLTNGHPFLLQHLCFQVWERIHDRDHLDQPTAMADDVAASVSNTLEEARNALSWLWDGLSPAARVIASALAGAGNRSILQDELEELLHESGVRVVMRELRHAPELLEEWDLIESSAEGYRFRVELLRRWIEKQRPLARIQRELDFVKPLAETLYQAGESYYKVDELDTAAERLREALTSNPNHARAAELLADILIVRQQWPEARELLEQLNANYPALAGPRLVQVLMELTKSVDSEEQQLQWLERVTELQPKHSAADALKRQKWEERGQRLRAAGDLANAITAYQRAGLFDVATQLTAELREQELERELAILANLEEAGTYSSAFELVRKLAERFADLYDWSADLERLERLASLSTLDRRAERALAAGDQKAALSELARIVTIQPTYNNATARLHAIATGVDPNELNATLLKERSETRKQLSRAAASNAEQASALARAEESLKQLNDGVAQEQLVTAARAQVSAAEIATLRQLLKNASLRTSVAFGISALLTVLLILEALAEKAALAPDSGGDDNMLLMDTKNADLSLTDVSFSGAMLGSDQECRSSVSVADDNRFPQGICRVYFEARFTNNLVDLKRIKGPLCVKYIDPDGKVEQSADAAFAVPPQGCTPCTFGVRLNDGVSGYGARIPVALDEKSFTYKMGWGDDTRTSFKEGRHRVEFWWRNRRLGGEEFTVVK